jgi:hypothetical protein
MLIYVSRMPVVGWSTEHPQGGQQGFAQPYDAYGGGATQNEVSVKGKMINLIGAVRTLMRSECSLDL